MKYLHLFFLFFPLISFAQKGEVFKIDSLPKQGILLDKGWKWHAGDNPDWAKTDFDDKDWQTINPALDIHFLPQVREAKIGWFRLQLSVDSNIVNQVITLVVTQVGASEIYLNGKLLYQFGTVSANRAIERTHYFRSHPFSLPLDHRSIQTIAIRYSCSSTNFYVKLFNDNPCLRLIMQPTDTDFGEIKGIEQILRPQQLLLMGFFLLLGAFSLFLYFLFKTSQFYLYLGLYCLGQFGQVSCTFLVASEFASSTTMASLFTFASHLISVLSVLFFLISFYSLFHQRKGWFFYLNIIYAALTIPFLLLFYEWGGIFALCFYFILNADVLRLTFQVALRRRPGAWILFITDLLFYIFFAAYIVFSVIGPINLAYLISFLCLFAPPFGLSFFLAGEFARTNQTLVSKLNEVETLSAEKQQLLSTQNELLENQVTERTSQLNQSLENLKTTQNQLIQKEKLASLGELTAGIAHEIQNPLNFVNNFSELSVDLIKEIQDERRKTPDTRDEELENELLTDLSQNQEKINLHGKRASNIVKGMLEHSRTNTGERELTDLNKLADEYLRLSYHGMRAKDKNFNADFKTDFDENLPKIMVMPQDIGRVLLNLYNNAFYVVSQKQKNLSDENYEPTVTISTRKLENSVEIRIKDNGTGIPDEVKAKIFQPFFTTKPTGEGTGLGLSLSYDIITKGHGGTLEVISSEGEDTEFIIHLPIITI